MGRAVEHATSALRSRLHAGRDVVDTSNLSLADAIEQELERKRFMTGSEFAFAAPHAHGLQECSSTAADDGMQRPGLPSHVWDQEHAARSSSRSSSPVPRWVLQAASADSHAGHSRNLTTTSPLPQGNDRLLRFLHPRMRDSAEEEDAACSNMTLMDALRQQRVKKGIQEPSASQPASDSTCGSSQSASHPAYSNYL